MEARERIKKVRFYDYGLEVHAPTLLEWGLYGAIRAGASRCGKMHHNSRELSGHYLVTFYFRAIPIEIPFRDMW